MASPFDTSKAQCFYCDRSISSKDAMMSLETGKVSCKDCHTRYSAMNQQQESNHPELPRDRGSDSARRPGM